MVKHVIIQILDKASVVLFIIVVLGGLISGYQAGGFMGAIGGLITSVIIAVFFFGILFVQLEMNENLRAIRQQLEKSQTQV
jgi:hypothetical protein